MAQYTAGNLAIDFHSYLVALNDNLLRPPLVILGHGSRNVYHVIEAAGFFPNRYACYSPGIKAPARPIVSLVTGMEINSAV